MKELKLFGLRLKELRTVRKLSQEQLAAKADISSKYTSRIEMGQHFPSIYTIKKLADALHVELKDLFEFAHEVRNSMELKEIISKLLKEADDEKLKLLVKILRAVVR